MDTLNPFSHKIFDYRVVSYNSDLVTIQVDVPSDFVQTLPALLCTLNDSFRLLSSRVKVARAHAKAIEPEEVAKRMERSQQYINTVLDRFDKFRAAGASDREAIKQTRDYFQAKGLEITSFVVELFCRDNGRFKKRKNKNDLILPQHLKKESSSKNKPL